MMTVNGLRATSRVRRLLGCLVITCSVLVHPLAKAAPLKAKPAETTPRGAAKALLERGRGELKDGHPEQALTSFQAARQLDDSLDAAEGVADATSALGRPVAARAGYAAALEQRRASLAPDVLTRAQAKLDSLDAATAQLALVVTVEGVEIQVDGSDVGRSPLAQPLKLDPGAHEVKLIKPGYVALTQQFVLERGPRTETLTVTPEVMLGKLQVSTSAAQGVVELLIDNRGVGLLPWEGSLPVGKVTLVARSNDATSRPLEVNVTAEATTPVVLTLEPNAGALEISTRAAGVRISIDGRLVGVQNWRGSLPVGVHHLAFVREGFESQERDVQVQGNASNEIVIERWVPLKTAAPEPQEPDDRGLYFRLDLGGVVSNTTDSINAHCAEANSDAHCSSTHGPFGASLGLRVGYRFKWIAPEVWGLGSFGVSYVKAQFDESAMDSGSAFYGAARREDYIFFRYGWAAGVGVRATTPTNWVSGTLGVGFGVFSQWGQYARTTVGTTPAPTPAGTFSIPSAQSASSSAVHAYAPGFLLDGGVLLGSSPGTKVFLGVMLAVELAAAHDRTAPNVKTFANEPYGTPGLDVAAGTQYRFGPVLGFQFGY